MLIYTRGLYLFIVDNVHKIVQKIKDGENGLFSPFYIKTVFGRLEQWECINFNFNLYTSYYV